MIQVVFKNNKMKKICENATLLVRKYGDKQAAAITLRLSQIKAAENLSDVYKLPQVGLHSLKGNYKGYLAVSIIYPYRIIFIPLIGDISNYEAITSVKIMDIKIDYHKE